MFRIKGLGHFSTGREGRPPALLIKSADGKGGMKGLAGI